MKMHAVSQLSTPTCGPSWTPPTASTAAAAPARHSLLYTEAATAGASRLRATLSRQRLPTADADAASLLTFLVSSDRTVPVVWLFDALDEFSANVAWNDAVQAILKYKVYDGDIVIFTARPSRSQSVGSSHWDAMRLVVRRWTSRDVDRYVRAYAKQVMAEESDVETCVSRCHRAMALLADTEFEAVPLFCELVCYHVAVREEPPGSIAGLFEAALTAILARDVRKQLDGVSEASTLRLLEHHLAQAYRAAELIGWRVVSRQETGYFTLTDEEERCLLPSRLTVALCSKNNNLRHRLRADVFEPKWAHGGWLVAQRNRPGWYTFLRKPLVEYMVYRLLKRQFELNGKLPSEVTLAPTWHLPLRLLADDAASMGEADAQRVDSPVPALVAELTRLLAVAMDTPSSGEDDFFALKRYAPPSVIQRRMPLFAATAHGACIDQVVSVLHDSSRSHASIRLPAGGTPPSFSAACFG